MIHSSRHRSEARYVMYGTINDSMINESDTRYGIGHQHTSMCWKGKSCKAEERIFIPLVCRDAIHDSRWWERPKPGGDMAQWEGV
jgi:hypothetical protein